ILKRPAGAAAAVDHHRLAVAGGQVDERLVARADLGNASTRRSPIGAVRGRPAGSKAGISPPNSSQGGRSI
ncbi:MAG: hypothetical protein ACLVJ8_14610, partial [Ruthenibacterium lactatiformans]